VIDDEDRIVDLLATWPKPCREVAEAVIGEYGPPAEVGPTALVWHWTGPWKRMIVQRRQAASSDRRRGGA
jgi:hypothetical protein